jgi:hypothetical protein
VHALRKSRTAVSASSLSVKVILDSAETVSMSGLSMSEMSRWELCFSTRRTQMAVRGGGLVTRA